MLRSTDRADRRDPLSQSTRLQAVDWDCGGHNPMLVTVVDVVAVFSVYVLPVCLNVVFLFLPPSQAALLRSLSEKRGHRKVISHSAGNSVVTGVWATKKPAHKHVPTTRKRIDFSLCVFGITFM